MSVIRLHIPAPDKERDGFHWDRGLAATAIVILHGEGRYWEAMDMLCRAVGWPPLVRGFSTSEDRDAWLAKVRGLHPELNADTGEKKLPSMRAEILPVEKSDKQVCFLLS